MAANLLQFVEVGELAADALCNIYQLHLGGREGGREQIELISSVNLDANERNLEDKNRTM